MSYQYDPEKEASLELRVEAPEAAPELERRVTILSKAVKLVDQVVPEEEDVQEAA